MSVAIDLILLLILAWTVFSYTKNGFVKSAVKAGRFIASVVLACALTSVVGGVFADSDIYLWIEEFIRQNPISIHTKATVFLLLPFYLSKWYNRPGKLVSIK